MDYMLVYLLQPFIRGGGDRSEAVSQRSQADEIKDAVRDLTSAYDQLDLQHDSVMSSVSAPNYNAANPYSRESLEYTRKWVENNDTSPAVSQPFFRL